MISKIFIIQSLKKSDYKSGEELSKKLSSIITSVSFLNAETDAEMFAELDRIKLEITKKIGQYIIHFDCHGNKSGIGIYDKSDNLFFLSWEDLRDKLREIYVASNQKAIISFSSCEGFNVAKLVAQFKPCPFYLITGSFSKISFVDSVNGYFLFYRNLINNKKIQDNVAEIRTTFPTLNFVVFDNTQLVIIAWNGYINLELTPNKIKERKDAIKTEIIQLTGKITKEQERYLDKQFTLAATEEHFKKFKEVFFS